MADWIDRLDEKRRSSLRPVASPFGGDSNRDWTPHGYHCPVPRCPEQLSQLTYRRCWEHLRDEHDVTIPDEVLSSVMFQRDA